MTCYPVPATDTYRVCVLRIIWPRLRPPGPCTSKSRSRKQQCTLRHITLGLAAAQRCRRYVVPEFRAMSAKKMRTQTHLGNDGSTHSQSGLSSRRLESGCTYITLEPRSRLRTLDKISPSPLQHLKAFFGGRIDLQSVLTFLALDGSSCAKWPARRRIIPRLSDCI